MSGMALAAATVLGAVTPALAAPDSSEDEGLTTIGLTQDDRLVQFNTNTPRKIRVLGKVSGLQDGDTNVVGIDFRVQDSQLYGVGDKGGIYRIVEASAVATKVSQLTVPLEGSSFGVDFNPAANALRVVSETGQNLRHPFATFTGAFFTATTAKDGTLTYPATPASFVRTRAPAPASTSTARSAVTAPLSCAVTPRCPAVASTASTTSTSSAARPPSTARSVPERRSRTWP